MPGEIIELLDSDEEQALTAQPKPELVSRAVQATTSKHALITVNSANKKCKIIESDPIEFTQPDAPYSASTMALLASLDTSKDTTSNKRKSSNHNESMARSKFGLDNLLDPLSESSDDEKPKKLAKVPRKASDDDKTAKAAEREAKKLEKEEEKEKKRLAKEEKTREKQQEQALAGANKLKKSHTQTVTEMICDVSSELFDSRTGLQLKEFLEGLGSRCVSFQSATPNIVRWRRSITAEWNDEHGVFYPIPEEIRREKHLLVLLLAKDFVDLAKEDLLLNNHVARIKSIDPAAKVIYVIEGLAKLLAANKSKQSRAYAAAVRNKNTDVQGGPSRVKETDLIDENKIEDAFLKLQVIHDCLIHNTTSPMDSAEAISSYTQHISVIPYKHAKSALNKTTNFCMDVGQVKTGADPQDVFNKMLQEVQRCTAATAIGIQQEFPTVQMLFAALLRNDDALKDVPVIHNKNGAASGRRVGQAMSRNIARILKGTNEWDLET